jgi:hypothetical protein
LPLKNPPDALKDLVLSSANLLSAEKRSRRTFEKASRLLSARGYIDLTAAAGIMKKNH